MTRIAFDHYETQGEAAHASEALKVVGLDPGTLATAWRDADTQTRPAVDTALGDVTVRSPGLGVWLEGIGRLHLTGWLSQAATPGSSRTRPLTLQALFPGLDLCADERDRFCRTMANGGGVVAVQARDSEPHRLSPA